MRLKLALIVVAVTLCGASPTYADFLGISGTQHISAAVLDDLGTDFFSHDEALVYTDELLVFFDNVYSSPSEFTWAGAGIATHAISTTLIDITSNVMGHTSLDMADIEALASVSLTFTIENSRLVTWDWLVTGTAASSDAAVSLVGPDGEVAKGTVTLTPGVYTITAYCSFSQTVAGGKGTISSGFQLYLEQIPAPGTLALLGLAGLMNGRRRRE